MRNIWLILIVIITGIIILSIIYFGQKIKKEEIKGEYEYFPIYSADKEAEKEEINFYVKIYKNLSLIEKLKIIADQLSKFKFDGLPINILRIEERDNKKIAIIDLKELTSSDNLLPFWRTKYFQGSAGGYFTTLTLIKSFLQEDYKGEWIDGIEFYYEGKPILEGEWDHISLHGTIYRFKTDIKKIF